MMCKSIYLYINRLILAVACLSASLLWGACLRAGDGKVQDASGVEGLPEGFASMPDTAKVRLLLDAGVSVDSLASFVVSCSAGQHGSVTFTAYEDVERVVTERLGEENAGMYLVYLEANLQRLPLDKKYAIKRSMPLTDISLLGYNLGLEYVERVLDAGLKIGRVDLEIAEFHRACGSDEGLYEDFLAGFAAGIRASANRNVPPEIVRKYAEPSGRQ